MDETMMKQRLDDILRAQIPDDKRRRSLIEALPLYLWSIYGQE